MNEANATSRAYDLTRAERIEPARPPEPAERQPHCQATDPKRCDFPNCHCGWP